MEKHTQPRPLYPNLKKDCMAQIESVLKEQGITPYRMCKETGVNKETFKRMRAGKKTRFSEYIIIAVWIDENGY